MTRTGFDDWKSSVLDAAASASQRPSSNNASKPVIVTRSNRAMLDEVVEGLSRVESLSGLARDKRSDAVVVKDDWKLPWGDVRGSRNWSTEDDLQLLARIQSGELAEFRHFRSGEGADGGGPRKLPSLVHKQTLCDAVVVLADSRAFDPLLERLGSLPNWDGVDRVQNWLHDLLGAEASLYNREAASVFIAGCISRALNPGVKFDSMVVLCGPQGCGKSTALRRLALDDRFFAERIGRIGERESIENTCDAWIVEDPELASLRRASPEQAKAFISATHDKARHAYRKTAQTRPRGFVLAGTTNEITFLTDYSGNRRFLPVQVGVTVPEVDVFSIECADYVDQLWAQALEMHLRGTLSTTLSAEAEKEAEGIRSSRLAGDLRAERLLAHVSKKPVGYRLCLAEGLAVFGDAGRDKASDEKLFMTIMGAQAGWKWSSEKANCQQYSSRRYFEKIS